MSRERYTRAINLGNIRCSTGELEKWEQLTGISKKIFSGEEVFTWHIKGADKTQPAISEEDWKKLFAWRNGQTIAGSLIPQKTGMALQKQIHDSMKNADRKDNRNTWNFYRLCYFLEQDRPASLKEPDDKLKGIQEVLETLTFDLADMCGLEYLRALKEVMDRKQEMITGILVYKAEKQKN